MIQQGRDKRFKVEALEQRRLLSAAVFAAPVVTSIGSVATSITAGAFFNGLDDVVAVQTADGVETFSAQAGSTALTAGASIPNVAGVTPLQVIAGPLTYSYQGPNPVVYQESVSSTWTDVDLILVGETQTTPATPVLQAELANAEGTFTAGASSQPDTGAVIPPGTWNHVAAYSKSLNPVYQGKTGIAIFTEVTNPTSAGYIVTPANLQVQGNLDGSFAYEGASALGYGDIPDKSFPTPDSAYVATGDINDDGSTDTAAYNPALGAVEYFGHQVSTSANQIALADINGDGCADLIAWGGKTPDKIFTWFGQKSGILTAGPTLTTNGAVTALAAADFNGDGKIDLATNLGIFYGNGGGTVGSVTPYPAATSFGDEIITADLNGDGRPDVVGLSPDGKSIVSLINTTNYKARAPTQLTESEALGSAGYQKPTTITATLTYNPAMGTPSGTINFYEELEPNGTLASVDTPSGGLISGQTLLGSAEVNSHGVATFIGSKLAIGTHGITAEYEGDSSFAAVGLTGQLALQVRLPTVITFEGFGSKAIYTFTPHPVQPIWIYEYAAKFAVTSPTGLSSEITGGVSLTVNGTYYGSAGFGGLPDWNTALVPAPQGRFELTASYSGNSEFAPSQVGPIEAGPPVAGSLAFTQQPSDTTRASALPPITVDVGDSSGNVLVAYTSNVTLAIASGPSGAVLGGTTTVAAVNGVAMFIDLSITTPGDYTLVASDGTDTTASSNAFTVAMVGTSALSSPIVRSSLPATAVAGSVVKKRVMVDVTNSAAVISSGKTTINVFASADGIIDGNSILLGSIRKRMRIRANGTLHVAVSIRSLPAGMSGNYMLLSQVTDPTLKLGFSSTGPTLTVSPPIMSLVPSEISTSPSRRGSRTVSFVVTNTGNITSTGITTIKVYASTDGTTTNGTAIYAHRQSLALRPSKPRVVRVHLTAAQWNQVTSDGLLVVQIVDPTGQVQTLSMSAS